MLKKEYPMSTTKSTEKSLHNLQKYTTANRVKPALDLFARRVSRRKCEPAIRKASLHKSRKNKTTLTQKSFSKERDTHESVTPIQKVEETPEMESDEEWETSKGETMIVPETVQQQSFSVLDELLSFDSPRKKAKFKPDSGIHELSLQTKPESFKTDSSMLCGSRGKSTKRHTNVSIDDKFRRPEKQSGTTEFRLHNNVDLMKTEVNSSFPSWQNSTRLDDDCERQERELGHSVKDKQPMEVDRTFLLEKSVLDDLLDFGNKSIMTPLLSYGNEHKILPTKPPNSDKRSSILDELMG